MARYSLRVELAADAREPVVPPTEDSWDSKAANRVVKELVDWLYKK